MVVSIFTGGPISGPNTESVTVGRFTSVLAQDGDAERFVGDIVGVAGGGCSGEHFEKRCESVRMLITNGTMQGR